MLSRCPGAMSMGVAHLSGYLWHINHLGHASIRLDPRDDGEGYVLPRIERPGVFGMLYL